MHGSGSAGNNIREGGAILEVAMEDNDNNFSKECCIGGNIIKSNATEGLTSLPPPVESRVMACHAMCGSGSAENNIREGGAILEVAMDDDDDNFLRNAVLGATSSRPTLLKD
jgi:hypothetical protein